MDLVCHTKNGKTIFLINMWNILYILDDEIYNLNMSKIPKEEKEIIDTAINKASQALNFLIENGLEKTMNKYN